MGKVLGGGSSISVMAWTRGHKDDWDFFAAEAGDTAWSYESALNTSLLAATRKCAKATEADQRLRRPAHYEYNSAPVWQFERKRPMGVTIRTANVASGVVGTGKNRVGGASIGFPCLMARLSKSMVV